MKTLQVILMLPLMIISFPVGWLWRVFQIGFVAGAASAEETGNACYADIQARKKTP